MPITRRRKATPPEQPENNNHSAEQAEEAAASMAAEQGTPIEETPNSAPDQPAEPAPTNETAYNNGVSVPPVVATPPQSSNGDRVERQDYNSQIEGGRRTARGEYFRRPPQPPPTPAPQPAATFATGAAPQAPTHEISLPLGNLLHLAYNPGYTGADEARSALLHRLAEETHAGGRARCWNCGSIAIAYERWNTRSRTFGEIGIAYCEICGVWSVM
jgi:hypothetical protein